MRHPLPPAGPLPLFFLFVLTAWPLALASADQEASNAPHIAASEHGRCYVKSIPDELYAQKGRSHVYRVEHDEDVLLHSFDWFSHQIYVACNVSPPEGPVGISVVRFGRWSRGRKAKASHLALAFYFDGKLVRDYSTLDLAGSPSNVQPSVSHYVVVESVDGYEWVTGNEHVFVVRTIDGRRLAFDPATGALVDGSMSERQRE